MKEFLSKSSYGLAIIISVCSFTLTASAQDSKAAIRKAYLQTCLEQADKNYDSYELSLYRWWCDCSAEKISNRFGMADFLKMKFMSKKETSEMMQPVIKICTDTLKRNMAIHRANKK